MKKQYVYVCECDFDGRYDDTKANGPKPTTVNKQGRCHGCGYYAFKVDAKMSHFVMKHGTTAPKVGPKVIDDESWMNG